MAAKGRSFLVGPPKWVRVEKRGHHLCWAELGPDCDGAKWMTGNGFTEVVVVSLQYLLVVLGGFG